MSGERWNEARVAKLKELQKKGLSLSQIAGAINEDEALSPAGTAPLTRNAVIGKLDRLGLRGLGRKSDGGTNKPKLKRTRIEKKLREVIEARLEDREPQIKIVAPAPIEKAPQAVVAHPAPTGLSKFRSSYFDTVAKLLNGKGAPVDSYARNAINRMRAKLAEERRATNAMEFAL